MQSPRLTKRERQIVEWLRWIEKKPKHERAMWPRWQLIIAAVFWPDNLLRGHASAFANAIERGEPWRGDGDA